MSVVGRIDRGQRKHPVFGVPLAVLYKFFDDQGNYLAAAMTYYAFVAIFPLLLLASSILGFILQGDPDLQERVLNSALAQFPIIGDQLGRPEGLTGSRSAVVVGALAALYGALGVGQSLQVVQATAWGVPRNSRRNPVLMRLNSFVLVALAGMSVLAISVLSAVITSTEILGGFADDTWVRWGVRLLTILLVGLVMTMLFRVAATRAHHIARAAPGGFTVAILWQGLQHVGTLYVTNVIAGADNNSMNQTFALVLGLVGLLFIAAIVGVIGIEVNVVLARKLWPRALLTPFTDRVDLTEADRRAYAMYAQMQRHKGFETVTVRFDGRDGDTHEIVLDPVAEKTEKVSPDRDDPVLPTP